MTALRWTRCFVTLSALSSLVAMAGALFGTVDRWSAYTGPLVVWTGLSLLLWLSFAGAAVVAAVWTHLRYPRCRRTVWFTVAAGHFGYLAGFVAHGAIVALRLGGDQPWFWLTVLGCGAVLGCLWSARQAARSFDSPG